MIIMTNARFEREIEKRLEEQRRGMYLDRRCDELQREIYMLHDELRKLKGEGPETPCDPMPVNCEPMC